MPPTEPVALTAGRVGGLAIAFILLVGLTACSSYIDLGHGRYGVTRVSEERSPFGTNAGFAYLENCHGVQEPGYHYQKLNFVDCYPVTGPQLIQSQGQYGQILGGALTGLGFGLGSAFSGAGGSSSAAASSSSSSSSSAISGAAGHGHGR